MVPFARIKLKAFVADADTAHKDEEAKVEVEEVTLVEEVDLTALQLELEVAEVHGILGLINKIV